MTKSILDDLSVQLENDRWKETIDGDSFLPGQRNKRAEPAVRAPIRCYSRSPTLADVEFVASKLGDRAGKINRCESGLLLNSLARLLAQ